MGAVSDVMLDWTEVNHAASESASGSILSGQSALVSSHQPHSAMLGTRLGGMSEVILRMNSASRETKASSTLSAEMRRSLPSAYTTTPSNFLSRHRFDLRLRQKVHVELHLNDV